MGNFMEFYQNGGVFMHVISLGATVALTSVLLYGRSRRMGVDKPGHLSLADRLAGVCVAIGALGAVFGFIEMCYVLSIIEPEAFRRAAARASGIVVVPVAWSLMCAVPIWIATSVHRARAEFTKRVSAQAA